MTITCPELTYTSSLLLAAISGLIGYLSPYWQVDEVFTKDSELQISVGLSYGCVKEDKGEGWINTFCKPLPLYGQRSEDNYPYVSTVRWLITGHMIFMIVSAGLNLSSKCIAKTQVMQKAAALLALVSIGLGISGLVLFSSKITRYQNLFKEEFPEVVVNTVLTPGASFYMSAAGCSLFGFVCCVELTLGLRQILQRERENHERRLLLKDEIRFMYGAAPLFLDASSSLTQSGSSTKTIQLPVETCQVDIFGGQVPVHNKQRKGAFFVQSYRNVE